jgi:hypothetical protein
MNEFNYISLFLSGSVDKAGAFADSIISETLGKYVTSVRFIPEKKKN